MTRITRRAIGLAIIGLVVPIVASVGAANPSRIVSTSPSITETLFALGGGVLLAGCDAIGRVIVAPSEVPAGAVMAILGGPCLVWVLRQRSAL